jgi:hypothetical protein
VLLREGKYLTPSSNLTSSLEYSNQKYNLSQLFLEDKPIYPDLVNNRSSLGHRAGAVGCINRKKVDCDYLGLPHYSFLPRWEKERLRVKSLNKHTFSSSLGSCAEAERWIDKSINGIKRKDERKRR